MKKDEYLRLQCANCGFSMHGEDVFVRKMIIHNGGVIFNDRIFCPICSDELHIIETIADLINFLHELFGEDYNKISEALKYGDINFSPNQIKYIISRNLLSKV